MVYDRFIREIYETLEINRSTKELASLCVSIQHTQFGQDLKLAIVVIIKPRKRADRSFQMFIVAAPFSGACSC
jgi:hypothetical protein